MFSVSGRRRVDGARATVTWDDGRLTGDRDLCREVREVARAMEFERQGPVGGPYTTIDHLSDALTAAWMIGERFALPMTVTGDVPGRDPLPEGAIG